MVTSNVNKTGHFYCDTTRVYECLDSPPGMMQTTSPEQAPPQSGNTK